MKTGSNLPIEPLPIEPLPVEPSWLGESPFWHPTQRALWWCDIPGFKLHCFEPATARHRQWDFPCEPACAAPLEHGDILLAMRDGLWRFDPESSQRHKLADPPYDPSQERFNDGRADPQGRLWVGTLYEPRHPPLAKLYRFEAGQLDACAQGITVSNGLAFSPDVRTMYWSDTQSHTIFAFDFEALTGEVSARRVFATFAPRVPGQALADYGGRPDGAAVDVEGCYWVAMFEGARLLRFSPQGQRVQEIALPVQCPTMPCFGGDDLRTLYVTTSRKGRPEEELARQPWAGRVLAIRVPVPGLPVNFARLGPY